MTDPSEQMRGCILDMKTYNLAEQAGMFCDGVSEHLAGMDIDFSDSEFVFDSDEPYEVYFEWYFGDVRAGICFRADRDESDWFVNRTDGVKMYRYRRTVGEDIWGCSVPFLEKLAEELANMRGSTCTRQ